MRSNFFSFLLFVLSFLDIYSICVFWRKSITKTANLWFFFLISTEFPSIAFLINAWKSLRTQLWSAVYEYAQPCGLKNLVFAYIIFTCSICWKSAEIYFEYQNTGSDISWFINTWIYIHIIFKYWACFEVNKINLSFIF